MFCLLRGMRSRLRWWAWSLLAESQDIQKAYDAGGNHALAGSLAASVTLLDMLIKSHQKMAAPNLLFRKKKWQEIVAMPTLPCVFAFQPSRLLSIDVASRPWRSGDGVLIEPRSMPFLMANKHWWQFVIINFYERIDKNSRNILCFRLLFKSLVLRVFASGAMSVCK